MLATIVDWLEHAQETVITVTAYPQWLRRVYLILLPFTFPLMLITTFIIAAAFLAAILVESGKDAIVRIWTGKRRPPRRY